MKSACCSCLLLRAARASLLYATSQTILPRPSTTISTGVVSSHASQRFFNIAVEIACTPAHGQAPNDRVYERILPDFNPDRAHLVAYNVTRYE